MKLDRYTLIARVAPPMIAISPFPVLFWVVFGNSTAGVIWSFLSAPISAILFSELARDAGLRRQEKLWQGWGGPPTTRMLRHRDGSIDPITKARYHEKAASLIGHRLPSLVEEIEDSERANRIYEAAVKALIAVTRTTQFSLLRAENISYGFRRNLFGLRPYGVTIAIIVLLLTFLAIAFLQGAETRAWLCVSYCGLVLLMWLVFITSEWVRVPAEGYAHRLFESLDLIS